ncbi:MAG TPA: N,N-dimethylformamidase beta subunit family domain-containing protein [Ktedonobacterales bacterium]
MDRDRGLLSAMWFRLSIVGLVIIVLAVGAGVWAFSSDPLSLPPVMGVRAAVNLTSVPSHELLLAPPTPACVAPANAPNPIVAENACPGTDSWGQTFPLGPANAINAFAAPASVNRGDVVRLYASTTAHSYTFSVYRVGWYQGRGARLLYTSPNVQGINQPAPTVDPVTRAASCANWRDPVSLQIPTSWVSGVYIVKFTTSDNFMRYTLFVVRDDASRAPVLFQLALATYQAYNLYGGRSLYILQTGSNVFDTAGRSYAVSFDRPYGSESGNSNGLGNLPQIEGPLIRFLERTGYDMTYMADVDLVLHPQPLTQHKLLIIGGHDEYWSAGMRGAVTQARDKGVSLAFFAANNVYWQTRMAASPLGPDRVVICYKSASIDPFLHSHPSEVTVNWRSQPVSQPENNLVGQWYFCIPTQREPLVLTHGAEPYLAGTRLRPGDELSNMVYGEVDAYVENGAQPSNVTILAASPVICRENKLLKTSNATIYKAPSGAMVFDAGTFNWYVGLNTPWPVDATTAAHAPVTTNEFILKGDVGRFTNNILSAMIAASSHTHATAAP